MGDRVCRFSGLLQSGAAGGTTISDATAVVSGRFSACLIRGTDASIWCWGSDECGALASGDFGGSRGEPRRVDIMGETTRWASVAVGNQFACGVREDRSAWCWGRQSDRLVAENVDCSDGRLSAPRTRPERICF